MTDRTEVARTDQVKSFVGECANFWRSLPLRTPFLILLGAWLVLFQFYGNSTLGLVNTRSLFGWWVWTINKSPDETYAFIMPLAVIGLLLWKRKDLEALPKQICWPALGLVVVALLLHVFGYMIQQARVSVIAFVMGLYGLTGLVWGRRWLYATLFPFSLLLLCMPLGDAIEPLTFRLRLLATNITGVLSNVVLGIPVICSGTRLIEPNGNYVYDVAPACGGIRSLTAIFAFSVVYGFITFQTFWRRSLIVASALPLAVLGNVARLTLIVIAAEAFGNEAGKYVHASNFFSLVPYVPAILGMLLFGHFLEENKKRKQRSNEPLGVAAKPMLVRSADQEV
jgi:exosortase